MIKKIKEIRYLSDEEKQLIKSDVDSSIMAIETVDGDLLIPQIENNIFFICLSKERNKIIKYS